MNPSDLMFVGIDVSKDTLEVALDNQAKTECFGNTEVDIALLVKKLVPLAEHFGVIVLEATGGLERPAAFALCLAGLGSFILQNGLNGLRIWRM